MNAQPRTDAWAASNAHSTVHYRLQAEAELLRRALGEEN